MISNSIKNTLPSHKEQDHEQKEDSKEPAKSQSQKEEGRQKHRSHPYKHSVHARRSPPGKRGKRGGHEKSHTRSSKRWGGGPGPSETLPAPGPGVVRRHQDGFTAGPPSWRRTVTRGSTEHSDLPTGLSDFGSVIYIRLGFLLSCLEVGFKINLEFTSFRRLLKLVPVFVFVYWCAALVVFSRNFSKQKDTVDPILFRGDDFRNLASHHICEKL